MHLYRFIMAPNVPLFDYGRKLLKLTTTKQQQQQE